MSQSPLSADQLAHYRREGFVRVGRVLDDALLTQVHSEEARIRAFEPCPPHTTVFRSQMAKHSAVVRQVITHPALVTIATQLIGPAVCHWYNQFVTKLPDGNRGKSEFPWHQDNGYVSIEPATNVTIWIALDDVDERNGCVWVMPRSHERGLLDHRSASADSWHLTLDVEGEGVPALLKAGEAVAFTGLTLHRSKLNHTEQPRRAFFIEYADPAGVYSRPRDREQNQRFPLTSAPDTWLVAGQLPWPAPAAPSAY